MSYSYSSSRLYRSFGSAWKPRYSSFLRRPKYDLSLWEGKHYTPLKTGDFHGAWWKDPKHDTSNNNKAEKADDILRTLDVDVNMIENMKHHHTSDYETEQLVIRRGQEFTVKVHLDQAYNKDTDIIKLHFATGKTPVESKGTLERLTHSDKLTTASWGMTLVEVKGQEATVKVMASADAIVGEYQVMVNTIRGAGKEAKRHVYKHADKVVLLFNPWCKDDQVFMKDENQRKEYVLNDTGRVYVGTKNKIHGRPWYFGQFETVCLEAALYLLEHSDLTKQGHGNPTKVTRKLSAMSNDCDGDDGILQGNWSGEYRGGSPPTSWVGSAAILQQYMHTRKSVKYGQCWVFSGVLTTLCRALGIPARSVTNFESAHDKDYSMTIDEHVDTNGMPLDHLDDSVWNFHVWNEGWFTRPDLPEGNNGWQAFDATPQETSDGKYQCGPAPVAAVKAGNVYLAYDTQFILAEVNGDRIRWMADGTGGMVAISVRNCAIGSSISTKAVGSNTREDVTLQYKHPEGSAEEREVKKKASQYSSRRDKLTAIYRADIQEDMDISYEGKMAENGDMTLEVKITSKTAESRTVTVNMYGKAVYYNGVPGNQLGQFTKTVQVEGHEAKQVVWQVHARDYLGQLNEDADVVVCTLVRVDETGQVFSERETYSVDKPDLNVKVISHKVKVADSFDVQVSFTNPLTVPLADCMVTLEGPGIRGSKILRLRKSIPAHGEMSETVTLTPKFAGQREVLACFTSTKLSNVTGAVMVDIKK